MITNVKLRYFKRFADEEFDLSDHVILAGPNNSGKTSLLQAIVVWNLALQRWREKRGPDTGSTAKQRTGVPLARKDFTALPLREMDLLWTDSQTALKREEAQKGEKPGQPRVLTISLSGRTQEGPWSLEFEFRRQSSEQVYVKPIAEHSGDIPKAAEDVNVVHVPPFSGIGSEETRYDRPYQDLLIGQGKAGDILRNLLYEVYTNDPDSWSSLRDEVERIFAYRLLPPEYEGTPYIVCDYLPGIPKGKGKPRLAQLDVASAGSGFHQVLLLLGFFYARPSTVLLLDEPDAHLHIILQKQIYDTLRSIAAERHCQLMIATHAEILIDSTSPEQIVSFYQKPHQLVKDVHRDQVREALKRLTATDILMAELSPGILYLEDRTDFDILHAWARVLDHPLSHWFAEEPFWHANQGSHPSEARGHFFALRAIRTKMRGLLVLDRDNRDLPAHEVKADGLEIIRWNRYEVESYLVHPVALGRFIENHVLPLQTPVADNYLRDQLPPAVYRDPLNDHDYLRSTAASKTLLPTLFKKVDVPLARSDYYRIAKQMKPNEIPMEVKDKLDVIARAFGIDTPST